MFEVDFCQRSCFNSPKILNITWRNYYERRYSVRTNAEKHVEGVRENNIIQYEKIFFNMFNKPNKRSPRAR